MKKFGTGVENRNVQDEFVVILLSLTQRIYTIQYAVCINKSRKTPENVCGQPSNPTVFHSS